METPLDRMIARLRAGVYNTPPPSAASETLMDRPSFSRRRLPPATGAATLAAPFVLRGAAAQASKITVMTIGGSWGDSIRDLIAKPFTEKHKVEVAFDQRPNAQQLAALQAMRS